MGSVEEFWQIAAKRAAAQTLHALGMETRQRMLVKTAILVAILLGLWLFGSADASRDETIARFAIGAAVVALFPFLFCWNLVQTPAQLFYEEQAKVHKLEELLDGKKRKDLAAKAIGDLISELRQLSQSITRENVEVINAAYQNVFRSIPARLEGVSSSAAVVFATSPVPPSAMDRHGNQTQ